jgi:DNA polymerase-3 subunit gamma/tau
VLKQLNSLRSGGAIAPVSPAAIPRPAAASQPAPVAAAPRATIQTASVAAAEPVVLSDAANPSADLETLWAQLLEAVGRVKKFAHTYLRQAHPVSFAKGLFTIGFDPEFADQLGLVDNSGNHELLRTKLAELGHPNCQFKLIKAEAPAGRVAASAPAPVAMTPTAVNAPAPAATPPATAPAAKEKSVSVPFNQDDFKNDPLIQKALEVFKGTIVQVRA